MSEKAEDHGKDAHAKEAKKEEKKPEKAADHSKDTHVKEAQKEETKVTASVEAKPIDAHAVTAAAGAIKAAVEATAKTEGAEAAENPGFFGKIIGTVRKAIQVVLTPAADFISWAGKELQSLAKSIGGEKAAEAAATPAPAAAH